VKVTQKVRTSYENISFFEDTYRRWHSFVESINKGGQSRLIVD
jgi:hypothetical protein